MKVRKHETNKKVYQYCKEKGMQDGAAKVCAGRVNSGGMGALFFDLAPMASFDEIKDIKAGAEILADAIEQGSIVAAVCDYDSDGCHSAAVISRAFKEMGFEEQLNVMTPDRMTDGYGLNPSISQKAFDNGASVILTADNGISAFAGVDHALSLNMKVIITDHHLIPKHGMPNAHAIINPARHDCQWGNAVICGATVAFLTMIMLRDTLIERGKNVAFDASRMFQLIGAATIADCVPMVGINRSIVIKGLNMLRKNPYMGYKELILAYDAPVIDEGLIGFKIGPAINSAGRLGSAAPAITFLATDDQPLAMAYAQKLISRNEDRKEVQLEVSEAVMAQVKEKVLLDKDTPFLVLGDPSWHHGVVGIVSSRVSEETMKPSIIFGGADDEGVLKGSGRSGDSGLHMKNMFDTIKFRHPNILLGYGGHAAAAGCSIKKEDLESFKHACLTIGKEKMDKLSEPVVEVDNIFDYHDKENNVREMFESLTAAPFGQMFKAPVYAIQGVPLDAFSLLGKSGKHFQATVFDTKTVGFNIEDAMNSNAKSCTIIVSPSLNVFRGKTSDQLIINRVILEND